MSSLQIKRTLLWLLCIAIIFIVVTINNTSKEPEKIPETLVITKAPEVTPKPGIQLIGRSVQGREIEAYTYGDGAIHLVFIGGIHGGYEWNTVLLAQRMIDYLDNNPDVIPKNITLHILPSVNPDAVHKVTGKEGRFSEADVTTDKKILASARFNANNVDLNRNFDCTWQPKSTWQSRVVSAGTSAFSEPESRIIKDYLLKQHPSAVVFWHSKSNGVYGSKCEKGILAETKNLMNTYAGASGYPAIETFNAYPVTGAAEDWLASINIPAVTVELKTHETVEFEENLKGVLSVLNHYKTK